MRALALSTVLAAALLAATASSALMATLNIGNKTYAPGTYQLGPTSIASTDHYFYLQTNANNWTAAESMTVLLEESTDGGTTWRMICDFTSPGPIASTDQAWQCGLLTPPNGQTYQGRATITLSGGSLTTPVTVETSATPLI